MADEFTFNNSLAEQETLFEFQNRQFVYIPDQNSGSYSNGQIIFDLAGLSNSGKFIDFSQSNLVIPLVVNVNLVNNTSNVAENAFALSLKNGFHQLINSISVEVSNCQVVNLTSFSNLDINYKILTTSSLEDERNILPSLNFAKDTSESISYTATSSNGIGEFNNILGSNAFVTTNGWGATFKQNSGRVQRMLDTSFNPTNTNPSNFTSNAYCNANGKNYCNATADALNVTYYITATIPLRFLHDIFRKLPICRGAYVRLVINTNAQCSSTLTTSGTYNSYTAVTTSSTNNVFPYMISPIAVATGTGLFVAACTSVVINSGIGKVLTVSHPTITQARIYACCYEFSPIYENMYLTQLPQKKVLYNDILSFQLYNIAPGGTFSQILTNGVSRARYLLIHPMLSSVINGSTNASDLTNAGVSVGSPMNSPFSSCPGTSAPFASLTNFNVLLSGSSLYQSNINYGWESFLQEVRPSNALNGGISLGLSAGLLTKNDWENGHRFVYCDLSRKSGQASDDISRAIQIIGQNSSKIALDLYCIVGYEREITLSTSTGSLII